MQWTSREAFTLTTLQESSASTPTFMSVGHNSTEQIFQVQNNLIRNGGVGANPEVFNQVVIWALVDGFLFLAIVSGNALTIAAILMNRSIFHIVSNHFILSLTCSDLFVGLMLPYHMMFYVEPDLGQRFGFCITRLALIFLACSASVANIIGITVDRFLAIVYPLHYNKLMTKRLARGLIIIAWTLAISISVTPIFWNKWEENSQRESRGKCEFGYVVAPLYVKTIYIPAFVLFFTIICGFYVKIFLEARKHTKRMRQNKNDTSDQWKSVQVLMLVMGSFTISYMPFLIIVILNSIFQHNTKTVIYKISNTLAMANSAVNPLIYAWKKQEFKRAFWKILNCKSMDGNSFEFRLRGNQKSTTSVTPDDKTTDKSIEKI